MEPQSGTNPPPDRVSRLLRIAAAIRPEDWLLAGWVAVVAPLAGRIDGSAGPFDPGRPIDGTLCLLGLLGALICLATGRSDAPTAAGPGALERASIGPLTGGLLLVAFSGSAGLGLTGVLAWAVLITGIVVVVAVRLRWPRLTTAVRRALVTPLLLATGGIFWTIIDEVAGGGSLLGGVAAGTTPGAALQEIAFVVGILAAFSAVYYAMLIYAPRQVAEPEGGPLSWLLRYALFLTSVIVGVAWLRPFGV